MRILLALAATAIAAPAMAQERTAQDGGAPIVVTARPLADTARSLEQCIARHCSPKEEIATTIAHAENLYVAGQYEKSRSILARANTRNLRYAATYPGEVADLQRAFGQLTSISGDTERARMLQIRSFQTLRSGFGSDSERVLLQRLASGDAFLAAGRPRGAMDIYAEVERDARQAGSMELVGRAMLRQAGGYAMLSASDPYYRALARKEMARIARTTEPELGVYRSAAAILRARQAAKKGDDAAMETAIAELPRDKSLGGLVLIYEPTLLPRDPVMGVSPLRTPEWIDLRYRINANGRVQDVDMLRSSKLTGDWADQVSRAILQRRYAPPALPAGSDGLDRVERFSLVFDQEGATGTRIAVRSQKGRVVALDLTPDEPIRASTGR